MVINLLTDENAVVRKKAFDIAVDFFKIYTSEEILKTVEKAKNLAKQTDPNIVAEGLFLMMALILSHPYENESWTEELLIILLKKYKTIKIVKDDFREFAEKYWDTHKGHANLNNISLSPDTYYELREISSSHSYFV
jgi:Domain of unknown function (DUF3437).